MSKLTFPKGQIGSEFAIVRLPSNWCILLVQGLGHEVLLGHLDAGEHKRLAGIITVSAHALVSKNG